MIMMRLLCVSCNNYGLFSVIILNNIGRGTEPNFTFFHRRVAGKVFYCLLVHVCPPQCYKEIEEDLSKLLKSIKEELQS